MFSWIWRHLCNMSIYAFVNLQQIHRHSGLGQLIPKNFSGKNCPLIIFEANNFFSLLNLLIHISWMLTVRQILSYYTKEIQRNFPILEWWTFIKMFKIYLAPEIMIFSCFRELTPMFQIYYPQKCFLGQWVSKLTIQKQFSLLYLTVIFLNPPL